MACKNVAEGLGQIAGSFADMNKMFQVGKVSQDAGFGFMTDPDVVKLMFEKKKLDMLQTASGFENERTQAQTKRLLGGGGGGGTKAPKMGSLPDLLQAFVADQTNQQAQAEYGAEVKAAQEDEAGGMSRAVPLVTSPAPAPLDPMTKAKSDLYKRTKVETPAYLNTLLRADKQGTSINDLLGGGVSSEDESMLSEWQKEMKRRGLPY